MIIYIFIDSKSIEDDIIQIQSRCMSDPTLFEIDSKIKCFWSGPLMKITMIFLSRSSFCSNDVWQWIWKTCSDYWWIICIKNFELNLAETKRFWKIYLHYPCVNFLSHLSQGRTDQNRPGKTGPRLQQLWKSRIQTYWYLDLAIRESLICLGVLSTTKWWHQ